MFKGINLFARSGDASRRGLAWPRNAAATRETMIFNVRGKVVADPDRAARELLSG